MQKLFFLLITIIFFLGPSVVAIPMAAFPQAHAQTGYTLLEPTLKEEPLGLNAEADFGTFMQKLYTGIFKFSALFAVVMLIYGGVLYVFGGLGLQATEKGISEAKDVFWHLGVGGGILLLSYLALYTINPKLVDLRFSGDKSTFPAIWESPGYSNAGLTDRSGGGDSSEAREIERERQRQAAEKFRGTNAQLAEKRVAGLTQKIVSLSPDTINTLGRLEKGVEGTGACGALCVAVVDVQDGSRGNLELQENPGIAKYIEDQSDVNKHLATTPNLYYVPYSNLGDYSRPGQYVVFDTTPGQPIKMSN